ncbi:unknown [Ruminococcus sp. CAG:90]|nr:unknown [Ruminococcus sp. CAG:90]
MDSLRKHISSRNPHQFIILRTQHLQIPRQCRTVTAHIHNPLRLHFKYCIQKYLITALPWRVYHDNVCINAILLILSRQHFLCFSDKKLYILNAIELRILSCIVNGLWYDLHAADEFCFLGQEQGDSSDSAVQIPDSFISRKAGVLQSLSIQFFGLDGIDLEKGQGRDLIGNISDAVRYIGLSPKEAKLITQDHIVPFFINIDGNAGHFRNFTE